MDGDGSRAFDPMFGAWRVSHRRLKARLCGSDEWERFGGESSTRPILGGAGNVEDNLIAFPGGPVRAAAFRSFDAASGDWSIWWLDGRAPHALQVPVVGRFTGGEGAFYADDEFEGRPIRVRFLWRGIEAGAPHWEQAFSGDGGRSWETNWEMDFSRAG